MDMEPLEIEIVLDEHAIMPDRAHPTDAGLDLFAPDWPEGGRKPIWPGGHLKIDTGVHVAIPEGYKGSIEAKSSHMAKSGILTAGTIDVGYTGSICVVLFNFGASTFVVEPKMKIAQLVIEKIATPRLKLVEKLQETARGNGGFGSTGAFAANPEKPHIHWEAN